MSQFPKVLKFLENMQRGDPWKKKIFSFLFNTVFYSGIPKETIRMPFRGLTMLKSRKLVIKGGLCYRFAMVSWQGRRKLQVLSLSGWRGWHAAPGCRTADTIATQLTPDQSQRSPRLRAGSSRTFISSGSICAIKGKILTTS